LRVFEVSLLLLCDLFTVSHHIKIGLSVVNMTDNRIVLESAAKSALYTIIIQVFVPVFVSYALQYTWSPAVALGELESGDMGITS